MDCAFCFVHRYFYISGNPGSMAGNTACPDNKTKYRYHPEHKQIKKALK